MYMPRSASLVPLALFPAPLAAAQSQYWLAPTIGLSARPAYCDSQPGYTCNASVFVSWQLPQGVTCGSGCHIEYCLTEDGATDNQGILTACNQQMLWSHTSSPYTLGAVNAVNTVYGEFRTVQGGERSPACPALPKSP
jgi:hypothetical protein